MASFTFDNDDSESLDLTSGGDNGAPQKKETPAKQTSPFAKPPARPAKDLLSQLGRPGLNHPQKPTEQPPAAPPVVTPAPAPAFVAPAPVPPAQEAPPVYVQAPQPVYVPLVTPQPATPSFQVPLYSAPPQSLSSEQPNFAQSYPPANTEYNPAYDPNAMQVEPQSFSSLKPVKDTQAKKKQFFGGAKSKAKPKTRGNFAGDRRKVLAIRTVVIIIAVIIAFNGIKNIVAPNSGPTRDQVTAAAQQSVGYTKFPTDQGGGVALGFTKAFLNYTNTAAAKDARQKQLLNYAPANVVSAIDPSFGSSNTGGTPSGTPSGTDNPPATSAEGAAVKPQAITDGPYLVGSKNVDDTHGVFTTMSKLNDTTWVYLQIPMLYSPSDNSLAVSGYPTFIPPTAVSRVTDGDLKAPWTADTAVAEVFQPDLINYLTAWASSNKDVISRYLAPDATLASKTGLGGTVSYYKLTDLVVETKDKTTNADLNSRRAEFTVIWSDSINQVNYTQRYRLNIKYDGKRWYIQDIQNSALIPNG